MKSRGRTLRVLSASGATEAAPAPLPRWVLVAVFTAALYGGLALGQLLKP